MDADGITSARGREALALAETFADPSSLAAATALRRRFPPELSASALEQVHLRRRAVAKFGQRAANLFLTADGLEQATRPAVAAWRARRLAGAGATEVLDLGCGIGADALAFAEAGLRVVAVELDPATAALARANLAGQDAEVVCGDAVQVLRDRAPGERTAVFCDPARRTARGRTWRVDQFTPPWHFALSLLADQDLACVKLGPGLPSELVPDDCEARWVSERGDLVEVGLWRLPGLDTGRAATLLPGPHDLGPAAASDLPLGPVGGWLLEPDGAVSRAGLAARMVPDAGLRRLAPGVAYLTSDEPVHTPFATTFEVLEVLDAGERTLRQWVRDRAVGTLEIKKRGVEVDPATLRKRLRPKGPASATLVLTPTPDGVRALVVRRTTASM